MRKYNSMQKIVTKIIQILKLRKPDYIFLIYFMFTKKIKKELRL